MCFFSPRMSDRGPWILVLKNVDTVAVIEKKI